jgi:oxysterol-binding protein-related protein 3/6/7
VSVQKHVTLMAETQSQDREKLNHSLQKMESAFYACINEHNRLKEKFGLDPSPASKFLGSKAFSIENSKSSRRECDSNHHEIFYDAEEGDISQNDSSSDEYSMHEPEEIPTHEDEFMSPPYTGTTLKSGDSATNSHENLPLISPVSDLGPVAHKPRTKLPVPAASMENVSFMGILRNNVGKDLSTISMPIVLNEPINLLQKLCEELEYSDLLEKASSATDEVERMCLVAGFVVSGYSSSVHRAARKPFNPLLGETYETNIRGFKFVAEKVSHHPPIMAMHAESPKFEFHQDSLMKTKFWGKSMELNNTGTCHLKFPLLNDHYVWNKVTSSIRNVFSTSRFVEHHGTMTIKSVTTGYSCVLNFKESGYFTSANNEVVGDVFAPSGKKMISLW